MELIETPPINLDRLHSCINSELDRYSQFGRGCPDSLAEAIRYTLLAPGKRLRPQLVLMAAQACGGSVQEALPAACAVEMVHTYSLVHDDLPAMDDDDLRRGQPTCHKLYGEDVAILVGDALLARAFEILLAEIQPAERAVRCAGVLGNAAGATGLVGGQADDLANDFSNCTVEQLESIHQRKTGALFVASLEMGGIIAGANDTQRGALKAYGSHLGLAFQITDDLLDVTGNPKDVGKRLDKDANHGKLTFPELLGVENSRCRAAESIDQARASLAPLGEAGADLHHLANFVLNRNR